MTCPSCGRRTSLPHKGRDGVLGLPNDILSSLLFDSSLVPSPDCDECGAPAVEKATHRCLDCRRLLCELHSRVHPITRGSIGHRLSESLDGTSASDDSDSGESAGRENRNQPVCAYHPTTPVTQFCRLCQQALCRLCRREGKHGGAEHTIISMRDAEGDERRRVLALAKSVVQESLPTVQEAHRHAAAAVRRMNDGTEMAKAKISADAARLISAVRERESALLRNVDQVRAQKIAPLEEEERRLGEVATAAEHATSMAGAAISKLKCEQFLSLSGWLGENLLLAQTNVESVAGVGEQYALIKSAVHQQASLKFVADTREIEKMIGQFGLVTGELVDIKRCSLQPVATEEVLLVKNDVLCHVHLVNKDGSPVSGRPSEFDLTARVVCAEAENTHPVISVETTDKIGTLLVRFLPDRPGRYLLFVTIGNRDLPGSPVSCSVGDLPFVFESQCCASSLDVSHDGRSIRHLKPGHAAALGPAFSSGRHSWRVRVDGVNASLDYLLLGVAKRPLSSGLAGVASLTALGWTSKAQSFVRGATKHATIDAWHDGDIIVLEVDCEQNKVSMTNSQTGSTSTINGGVHGGVVPYFYMYNEAHSITLLPCMPPQGVPVQRRFAV